MGGRGAICRGGRTSASFLAFGPQPAHWYDPKTGAPRHAQVPARRITVGTAGALSPREPYRGIVAETQPRAIFGLDRRAIDAIVAGELRVRSGRSRSRFQRRGQAPGDTVKKETPRQPAFSLGSLRLLGPLLAYLLACAAERLVVPSHLSWEDSRRHLTRFVNGVAVSSRTTWALRAGRHELDPRSAHVVSPDAAGRRTSRANCRRRSLTLIPGACTPASFEVGTAVAATPVSALASLACFVVGATGVLAGQSMPKTWGECPSRAHFSLAAVGQGKRGRLVSDGTMWMS